MTQMMLGQYNVKVFSLVSKVCAKLFAKSTHHQTENITNNSKYK